MGEMIEIRDRSGNLVQSNAEPRVICRYFCEGCRAVVEGEMGLKNHPGPAGDCGPLDFVRFMQGLNLLR